MPVHTAEVVGSYVHDFRDDTWWWSEGVPGVYAGLPRDGGLDELTSHLGRREGDRLREALVRCVLDGKAFALQHEVVDVEGRARTLTLTGGSDWARSALPEVRGLVLDVEHALNAATHHAATISLDTALASHAVIDQAKGALMLVYGLDDQGAFDLLRWSSMRLNVKLSTIAARIVRRQRSLGALSRAGRDAFEAALSTAVDVPAPRGPRPSRVHATVRDGHAPVIGVCGDADLRCAKDLFDAMSLAWPAGRERGLVVVDLAHATRLGPTVLHTLGSLARRAARDGVRLRVDLPLGDPHGWGRQLPAEAAGCARPQASGTGSSTAAVTARST